MARIFRKNKGEGTELSVPLHRLAGGPSLPRLHPPSGRAPEIPGVRPGPTHCVFRLELGTAPPGAAGPVHRLVGAGTASKHSFYCLQLTVSRFALARGTALGLASVRAHGPATEPRLGRSLRASRVLPGELCGPGAFSGYLLPGGQLAVSGADHGTWQGRPHEKAEPLAQGRFRLSAHEAFSPSTVPVRMSAHKLSPNTRE